MSDENLGRISAVPWVRFRVPNRVWLDKAWLIVRPILALSPLVPFLTILWLIWNRTSAIPWWDEWDLVPLLDAAADGTLGFADLWAPHNEHRIVIPRLISLVLIELTGWNRQIQMTVNLMIGVVMLLLLLGAVRRTFGSTDVALMLAAPFALLVLSLTQYENWLAVFQIAFIATALGVSICAWALVTRTGWAALSLALVGALVACLSSGAGAAVWIAFLPAVWRHGYRKVVVWVLVALGVMVPYLIGLRSYLADRSTPADSAGFMLGYLGGPVGYGNTWVSIGATVVSMFVLLAGVLTLWRLRTDLDLLTVWLGLAAFAVGCAALTAVGRPPSVGGLSIPTRYHGFAAFWWVAVITISVLAISRLMQSNRQPGAGQVARLRIVLVVANTVALLLLFIGLIVANGSGFRDSSTWQAFQRKHQDCVLAYRYISDDCLSLFHPSVAFERAQLRYLDEHHLTIFRDFAAIDVALLAPVSEQALGWIDTLDGHAVEQWRSRRQKGVQTPTHRAQVPAGLAIPVHGWAVDPTTNGPAGGVLVTIDDRAHVWTEYGTSRPDVAAAYEQPAYESTGFSALIPAEALPPGSHHLTIKVLTPDRRAYTVLPQIVELIVKAGSPLDPVHLTRLEQTTLGVIQTVNGFDWPIPRTSPLALPIDQPIQVNGWTVDAPTGRLARGAFLAVDDKWYIPVTLGLPRYDVAVVYENRQFALSGYEAEIPAGALPPGRHVLTLRVLTQDRRSYYSPTPEQTIEIEVQRGP